MRSNLSKIAFVVFLTANSLFAVEAFTSLSISIPQGDKLELKIPTQWQRVVIQPSPELPPSVRIRLAGANPISLQMTWLADPDGKFAKPDDADAVVTKASEQYISGSVEKRVSLNRMISNAGFGSYATFTEAALTAVTELRVGQYRNVTTGLFVVGKQAAIFTLLPNDTKSPEYQEALRILTNGISKP